MGTMLAILRVPLILGWIFLCLPVQVVLRLINSPLRLTLPMFFHWVLTRLILGLRVKVHGTISTAPHTLFISNHLSYLDILALGSLMPCSFVSKADVADWPIFGLLAKLQDTVFIRRQRHLTKSQNDLIVAALRHMPKLVIFPEGTSTEGTTVLPFKSSLLQSVFGHKSTIMIQPVSIACSDTNGYAHLYPWYADMTLVDHLWKLVHRTGITAEITFLPPVPVQQFADRKQLADYAHAAILAAPHGVISR